MVPQIITTRASPRAVPVLLNTRRTPLAVIVNDRKHEHINGQFGNNQRQNTRHFNYNFNVNHNYNYQRNSRKQRNRYHSYSQRGVSNSPASPHSVTTSGSHQDSSEIDYEALGDSIAKEILSSNNQQSSVVPALRQHQPSMFIFCVCACV